jgi:hypothetical protein
MRRKIVSRRSLVLPLLAGLALALGVAGCSGGNPGTPVPTNGVADGGGTTSKPATASSSPLASLDPCSLMSTSQAQQLHLQSLGSRTVAGAPECRWQIVGGYEISYGVQDHAGLSDLNPDAGTTTSVTIGSHDARQVESPISCTVRIAVSTSSSVDTVVSAAHQQDCSLAQQYATLVEPKLPAEQK